MREDFSEEVAFHWATEGWGVGEEKGGWQSVPEKETVQQRCEKGHACSGNRNRSTTERKSLVQAGNNPG